jgi:hypothetical protein
VKIFTSTTLPFLAVRQAQRRVFHLARLLAEDGPQQLLFRRQLFLALGRDLAHQDVVGANLGAHADDAVLVEVLAGRPRRRSGCRK